MTQFTLWSFGFYNETGDRQFFIPGFGLIVDTGQEPVSTNIPLNMI